MSDGAVIGRVPGSSTINHAITSILMLGLGNSFGTTKRYEKMIEPLMQATLDSEQLARLLSRATEENANNFVSALRRRMPAFFYGQGAAMVGLNVD